MKRNHFSWYSIVSTVYFLGYIPCSPGTATSLVAMLTLYMLPRLSILVQIVAINVLFLVGAVASERFMLETGENDPPCIVIDEWMGMWLALFLAPQRLWLYALAFVIFRAFDIFKPTPISYLEKKAPGGLGVMLDDTCAGFFTFVIIQIICLFI